MQHQKGENSVVDQAGDFSEDLKLIEAKDIIERLELQLQKGEKDNRRLENDSKVGNSTFSFYFFWSHYYFFSPPTNNYINK